MNRKIIYVSLLLGAGIVILLPILLENTHYLYILVFVGLNSIVVLGLSTLWGSVGFLNLAPPAFYGIGAYTSGVLTLKYGCSPPIAMMVGVFVTTIIGLIIGIPTFRLSAFYFVAASLGFGIIMEIIFVQIKSVTGGLEGLPGIPPFSIGALKFDTDIKAYYLIWFFVFIAILLTINLLDSMFGKKLKAIKGSEVASESLGINVYKCKLQVFIFSIVFASIAGSLFAHFVVAICPKSFSTMNSLLLVTMAACGGVGSVWGAILGALVVTFISDFVQGSSEFTLIFFGLFLVLIMMFIPRGMAHSLKALNQRFKLIERFKNWEYRQGKE